MLRSDTAEIASPPMISYGYASDQTIDQLNSFAKSLIDNHSYKEPGRLSHQVSWKRDTNADSPLHELAQGLSALYLDRLPGIGSAATLSVVTDEEQFKNFTQSSKAASNWHQDFVTTKRGFFFAPENTTRLIVPLQAAPLCAIGNVMVDDAIQLDAIDETAEEFDRSAALGSGPVLVGADGVLVKSEPMPTGGIIHIAEPDVAYVIPPTSVHKSPEYMPTGRIFFQLDAVT